MDSDGARVVPADADSFEPLADFKINFRQLALRLFEMHGPLQCLPTWPFNEPGPVSADEKALLGELALEHYFRHVRNVAPGEPGCIFPNEACKAFGGALVTFAIFREADHEFIDEPATRLHEATIRIQSALANFREELRAYLEKRDAIHHGDRVCGGRAHSLFCSYPKLLAGWIDDLAPVLSLFDSVSLVRQIPEYIRDDGPRRALLVSLEVALASHGWKPDEILAVIHDGVKPNGPDTYRARKTRLRERLKYNMPKPGSATTPSP